MTIGYCWTGAIDWKSFLGCSLGENEASSWDAVAPTTILEAGVEGPAGHGDEGDCIRSSEELVAGCASLKITTSPMYCLRRVNIEDQPDASEALADKGGPMYQVPDR